MMERFAMVFDVMPLSQSVSLPPHAGTIAKGMMETVRITVPYACMGGTDRADNQVVIYNCTQHDCMLRVSF